MKKRFLAFFMSIAMMLGMLPGAFAEEVITVNDSQAVQTVEAATSGTCGDNVTWTLKNGTLTVSGTGDMDTYNLVGSAPWYSLRDSISAVVIEKGVTSIAMGAFEDCKNLKSVKIPDGLTSIGRLAFDDCEALTSVTIPGSVIKINEHAFSGCKTLKSAKIQNGVQIIGANAFLDCYELKSINIPNSVTTIGEAAFSLCYALTSVTIPASVTTIGAKPFGECYKLKSITVDGGNTAYISVDGVLFDKDKKTLVQYPVGKKDKSYTIPSSVTNIGEGAVQNCGALTSVTIPNGVTTIGSWAFDSCRSLTSVEIPASVTTIGDYVFAHRSALKTIRFMGNAPKIGREAFGSVNATAYYPKGNSTWTDDVKQDYGGKITWKEWDQNGLVGGVGGDNIDDILSIKLSKATYKYNGKKKTPKVIVKDTEGNTVDKSNYTVKYSGNRKKVGKYKVTVTFTGERYNGTKTLYFRIKK